MEGTDMEIKETDWRLLDQDEYLSNVCLKRIKFMAHSEGSDHIHCAFCWSKFSEFLEDLHEG